MNDYLLKSMERTVLECWALAEQFRDDLMGPEWERLLTKSREVLNERRRFLDSQPTPSNVRKWALELAEDA